jgi:Photoprotection regulator fluorescence recovery protein
VSSASTQNTYPHQSEPIWSRSEKTIARKAFDAALGRELQEVIQQAKEMANGIQQSSDLWDLEKYLTQRRKEIDRKYTYRHSELTQVFGRLLYERRISEEELRGLREDKLKSIRSFAKLLAEDTAA